ncbi:MAG: hypothetical protein KGL72_00780, partial [Actinomycetales bacterium]|nr:hypothetical protein [Actinomycetales bacterium]
LTRYSQKPDALSGRPSACMSAFIGADSSSVDRSPRTVYAMNRSYAPGYVLGKKSSKKVQFMRGSPNFLKEKP